MSPKWYQKFYFLPFTFSYFMKDLNIVEDIPSLADCNLDNTS